MSPSRRVPPSQLCDDSFAELAEKEGAIIESVTENVIRFTVQKGGQSDKVLALYLALKCQNADWSSFPHVDRLTRYVTGIRSNLSCKSDENELQFLCGKFVSTISAVKLNGGEVFFPGEREQEIEQALRTMATEPNAEVGIWSVDTNPGSYHVALRFSVADVQQKLASTGKVRSLTEIRESLEILFRCRWEVKSQNLAGHTLIQPILLRPPNDQAAGDTYSALFHPLNANAIVKG